MIATSEVIIHQAVVRLLQEAGSGRIEAERLWDNIYSLQYKQAKAGTTHAWVIGQYTFEFIKTKGV